MKSSQPLALAAWSLERLGFGFDNGPLIGDLIEEYRCGRSRTWCWRQVFAAHTVNFSRALCSHPILIARTFLIVWSVSYLYGLLFILSIHKLLIPSPVIEFAYLLVSSALWAFGGYIVANLHREHKTAITFVFAMSVLLWKLPWILNLLADTFFSARYRPYFIEECFDLVLRFASISVGGLYSTRRFSSRNPKCTIPSGRPQNEYE